MREDIRGGETDRDLYAPVDSLVSPVFAREDRYIVLKRREIRNALTDLEREILISICDKIHDYRCRIMEKPPLECVVVENDWPEYEPTWKVIEKRVKG